MITSIYAAILSKLNADSTLLGYLGGAYCFRAKMTAPFRVPSVTLMENSEKSDPRCGYNAIKKRDNYPTLQVDVWVSSADEAFPCTGEDADTIANRIDAVLLDSTSAVTGTTEGSWRKISSSQQYEPEERIWHNAIRYSFQYTITDS